MFNIRENDRLRKVLIMFLAFILLVSYLPLRIARASSEIELFYEGELDGGIAAGLPKGFAVLFTPPNGTYFLSEVKFCLKIFYIRNEDLANPLYVEIWDSNRVTLVNMTFHWGDFFNQIVAGDWITVDVPIVIQVREDFFICISGIDHAFPYILFLRVGSPLQERSYEVNMNDHSISFGPDPDYGYAIHAILSTSPPPRDLNGDGVIDIYDAMLLASAFGSTPNDTRWNPKADLNNDGVIDIYDAIFLFANFGKLP